MTQIMNILSWTCIVISLVGFIMFLLGKAFKFPKKRLPNLTIVLISLGCLMLAIGLAILKNKYEKNPYTHAQRKAALEITTDLSNKMATLDKALSALREAMRVIETNRDKIYTSPDVSADTLQKAMQSQLLKIIAGVDTMQISQRPPEATINILAGMSVPIEEVRAFYDIVYLDTIHEVMELLKEGLNISLQEVSLDSSVDMYKTNARIAQLFAEGVYYGCLELLSGFPQVCYDSFLSRAKEDFLEFPKSGKLAGDEAKAMQNKCSNRVKAITDSMALSLQKQNNELDQISSNLMQLEPAKTKSKEIIEMESRIIDNLSQLDIKRDSLENMKKTLQEKQSRIREKNMFSETDGQWDMWTKIITLARYKLYYDAIDSIDEYENKVKGKDPLTPVYTASVKKYFQLLSSYWDKLEPFPNIAGEDLSKLGIVVLGFENNIAHSVLKVGDIILTRDNKPVHDVDDYNQIAMSSTNRDFILLRLSQGGELIQTELTGSSSDPRISLVALNATME